jgi:hypothetical protein
MFKTLLAPAAASLVWGAPAEDKVDSLPQMEKFPYGVYSGFVPVKDNQYHYVFLESEHEPTQDPLVVWFNGGPGCSSMLGYAQEIGPWVMNDDDKEFWKNDYAWNKFANLLFVDSPAGVGFSHCASTESCIWNDENSAEDNFNVLYQLLKDKFPEYQSNDLYISGESYAGVYVPYVFRELHNYNMNATTDFKFNLKGWMIGNGVTNWKYDGVPSFIEMGFWHDLYSVQLHDSLAECNLTYFDFNVESLSDHCMNLVMEWMNETDHIFIYDIYQPELIPSAKPSHQRDHHKIKHRLAKLASDKVPKSAKEFEHLRRLLQKKEEPLTTNRKDLLGYNYAPWMNVVKPAKVYSEEDPCPYTSPLVKYFNADEVRSALHIPDYVGMWDMCNNTYNYTSGEQASQWIWEEMKASGQDYRLLKYSGDTDGAVPTLGTQRWINELNWPILEKYRPYYLENGELGGYVEVRDGLTFTTVHGAGHMVPQFKRAEAFYMIKTWLSGE